MSGICGIINFDGAPTDLDQLHAMAEASAYRGPDGIYYWSEGSVGLAHLALHNTPESSQELQPLVSRQGSSVLVSDARLDNRAELIDSLTVRGMLPEPHAVDSALILAAYHCWGAQCAAHLRGDFAFAIWDRRQRRLYLVRDQLGARPCYYHASSRTFAFASEIKQLRQITGVSDRLNDRRVAAQIIATPAPTSWTFFADVNQLSPAHTLLASEDGISLNRYWRLDPQKSIRYKRDSEYAEHFLALFRKAVVARLRSAKPVASMLSGGLDSSAVVSVAADHLQRRNDTGLPQVYTWDFTGKEAIKEADEQGFARQVASYWNLPLKTIPAHKNWPLSDIHQHPSHPDSPFIGHYNALLRATLLAARDDGASVLLTGTPGDNLVSGSIYSYADYLLTGRWVRLFKDLHQHARTWDRPLWDVARKQLLWPLQTQLHERFGRRRENYYDSPLPSWITASLTDRARFGEMMDETRAVAPHRFRSLAQSRRYNSLMDPLIPQIAIWLDQLAAPWGMEIRHPWQDVRLYEFTLAVPQSQLVNAGTYKYVVRNAMQGLMPETVRQRQHKAYPRPLFMWSLREKAVSTIRSLLTDPLVAQYGYVDAAKISEWYEEFVSGRSQKNHPLWYTITLELWLRQHFS